jgi:hypothetical protein
MRWLLKLFFAFFALSALAEPQVTYTDVAEELDIYFTSDGCVLASGLAFMDHNGDGLDDLIMTSCQGQPIKFYQNNGNGFSAFTPDFLNGDTSETRVVLWADYDNDGDKDLFIGNSNARNKFYRNMGNGVFVDYTDIVGLSHLAHATYAAGWADYDNDGWLDLYVANRSTQSVSMHNKLYRNNGDGTLTDVTSQAGVGNVNGATIATAWLDYNNDGWPDIYNANDRGTINRLFRNNANGTFTNISNANVNLVMDAMSVTVADIDNNGFLDIYITNDATGNKLLMNNGDGTFTESATQMGVQVNKGTWGSLFIDYDNDGDFDLFVSAMSSGSGANGIANDLFENQNGTFVNVSGTVIPLHQLPTMGAAMADFTQNGYYDIATISSGNERSSLLQNSGGNNNWIKVHLQGHMSNRDAIGSWIYVWCDGQMFKRYTQCGANFASQDAFYQIIGIGDHYMIDSVVVKFPAGTRIIIENPAINSDLLVLENDVILSKPEIENQSLFHIGPNPFSEFIQVFNSGLNSFTELTLELYNITGMLMETAIEKSEESIFIIPSEILSSGIYLLSIKTDLGVETHKLLHTTK